MSAGMRRARRRVPPGARGIAAAISVLGLGALTLLLKPPGTLLLMLLAALLWPWPAEVADVLRKAGLVPRLRRNLAIALLVFAIPVNLAAGGQLDGHLVYRGDFKTYYLGAFVGTAHGWNRLFDADVQRLMWDTMPGPRVPFLPFLNTPLQAWLVTPLLPLGYVAAYVTWVGLMGLALLALIALATASMPRLGWLCVALAASLWVVAYTLASGQNALLAALSLALCWWFLRRRREGLAGAALWLLIARPNAVFLVPLALLAAGFWRTFLTSLLGAAIAAAIFAVTLGQRGVQDFLALVPQVQSSHPLAHQMTLRQLLGTGLTTLLLQAVLGIAALAVARRVRGKPAPAILAGVAGSLLLTPYLHVQDYVTVLAALLLLTVEALPAAASDVGPRAAANAAGYGRGRAWERAGLGGLVVVSLGLAPPGWIFGDLWEVPLALLELGILGWLWRFRA